MYESIGKIVIMILIALVLGGISAIIGYYIGTKKSEGLGVLIYAGYCGSIGVIIGFICSFFYFFDIVTK